jgi:hypothetical protein
MDFSCVKYTPNLQENGIRSLPVPPVIVAIADIESVAIVGVYCLIMKSSSPSPPSQLIAHKLRRISIVSSPSPPLAATVAEEHPLLYLCYNASGGRGKKTTLRNQWMFGS